MAPRTIRRPGGPSQLGPRRARILKAIIDEYVSSAAPVGSATVLRRSGLDVSSATVRNEMAALEADGFISQPHTSAGRVPSQLGYRWFVDNWASATRLSSRERGEIGEFFAGVDAGIERLLAGTSRLLTSLTSLAAVVLAPHWQDAALASVHLTMLDPRRLLVVLVTRSGRVVKVTVDTDDEIASDRLSIADEILNRHLVGSSDWRLHAVTAEHPDPDVAMVLGSVRDALDHADPMDSDVYSGGLANLAAALEPAGDLADVIEMLEEQGRMAELLQRLLEGERIGVVVRIGSEVPSLHAMSVVVAPYRAGESTGAVGLLGPLRMDYSLAMSAVHAVTDQLESTLQHGD